MRIAIVMMLGGILAIPALPAVAQRAPEACAAIDYVLPKPFAGWTGRLALTSAAGRAGLPTAELQVGSAVDAALHSTAEVAYLVQPEKPGGTVSHGGLLQMRIERPGVYAVALGSGAWIDLLKGTTPVVSSAHGHGPACSSIRKVVDFQLTPGRYVIQVSANAAQQLAIMIAARP